MPGSPNAPTVEVRNLFKRFGSTPVLQDISFAVESREVVGLIGSSGSGKSTLLRCINWLERPSSGDILLAGDLIGLKETSRGYVQRRPGELSRQRQSMAMVFQQFNLWPHKTALENVMEGLLVVRRMRPELAEQQAGTMLEKVGLNEKLNVYPSRLSGGQQQRVGIARAMAMEPRVILFDEPTSALDPELVGEVLNTIKQLSDEGQTMIVVTHEMHFAHDVCDRIIFLDDGSICDSGTPDYIFHESENPRTRDFVKRYAFQG